MFLMYLIIIIYMHPSATTAVARWNCTTCLSEPGWEAAMVGAHEVVTYNHLYGFF